MYANLSMLPNCHEAIPQVMTHFGDLTKFAEWTHNLSVYPLKKHYAGLSVFLEKPQLEELEVDGNPGNLDMRSGWTPRRLLTAHLDVSLYYSQVNPSLSAAAAPDAMQLQSRVRERKTTQC